MKQRRKPRKGAERGKSLATAQNVRPNGTVDIDRCARCGQPITRQRVISSQGLIFHRGACPR